MKNKRKRNLARQEKIDLRTAEYDISLTFGEEKRKAAKRKDVKAVPIVNASQSGMEQKCRHGTRLESKRSWRTCKSGGLAPHVAAKQLAGRQVYDDVILGIKNRGSSLPRKKTGGLRSGGGAL